MEDEELKELLEEARYAIFNEANWLFERQNLDGVFPVFYLFYSYHHGLSTCLDKKKHSGKGPDQLQNRLYNAAVSCFGGDPTLFEKLEELYAIVKELGRDLFDGQYVKLVEGMLCRTNLNAGSALLPNQRIATTICNILREKGCKSVYVAYSGAGSFVVESKDLSYHGAEPYSPANLIAEVLADAYKIKGASFDNTDPISKWTRRKVDAVIGNLPVDADFFIESRADHLLHKFVEKQDAFVKKLIQRDTARKAAAFLAHFEFANKRDYDEPRKQICERGLLDTVIALPENIFALATVPTYIVILDMNGGRKEATFIDATKSPRSFTRTISGNRVDLRNCASEENGRIVTVDYEQIQKADYSFNPFVYLQNAVCPKGMELVRLGDIADVIVGMNGKGRYLDPQFMSSSMKKVLEGIKPSAGLGMMSGSTKPVPGHSILLSLSKGARRQEQKLECGFYAEEEPCRTEFYLSVLKPNSKIIPEYLALALLSDTSFAAYYKNIQQYYTDDVRSSHLRERLIPIHTDLLDQRRVVAAAIARADMEDTVYNVVLAGARNKASDYTRLLDGVGCNIFKSTETVEGETGLEEILKQATKEGVALSKKVDAVVFCTDIKLSAGKNDRPFSGMDAIADLRLIYEPKGILFYAASNSDIDDIVREGIISERRLKPFRDGHFFINKKKKPVEALAVALRKELDTKCSDSARIRSLHRGVFEAADWIDASFEGNRVAEVLSDFLIAKDFGKDTARNLNDLRIVAHHLIDILKQWNIIPDENDLNYGAIPRLIYDQKFETTGAIYVFFDDTIMPRSLSSALVSLIEIGNEGSHTFKSHPLLGSSMLSTLMEFVLWLYKERESLQNRATLPWIKENKYEKVQVSFLSGKVERKTVRGKKIWVCGNVHLQDNPDLHEGDTVTFTKDTVSPEKNYRTPEITGYAPRDSYSIDGA